MLFFTELSAIKQQRLEADLLLNYGCHHSATAWAVVLLYLLFVAELLALIQQGLEANLLWN